MSDDPASNRDQESEPKYLEGYFLISEVNLVDPNFYHSVVLMVTHDDNGAFGLVVNRPSKLTFGDLVEGGADTPARAIPVYVGGPLQQEFLFILHTGLPEALRNENSRAPVDGVSFEPATESLVSYLKGEWGDIPEPERPDIRLYAGYSGWGPGQLESELRRDAWVVLKASRDIIFHPKPEEGWAQALIKKGPFYQIVLQTGFKPSMN